MCLKLKKCVKLSTVLMRLVGYPDNNDVRTAISSHAIMSGAPNSAKFRGGGVAEVTRLMPLPGSIFKKVHFLAFLLKAIKKCLFLR